MLTGAPPSFLVGHTRRRWVVAAQSLAPSFMPTCASAPAVAGSAAAQKAPPHHQSKPLPLTTHPPTRGLQAGPEVGRPVGAAQLRRRLGAHVALAVRHRRGGVGGQRALGLVRLRGLQLRQDRRAPKHLVAAVHVAGLRGGAAAAGELAAG